MSDRFIGLCVYVRLCGDVAVRSGTMAGCQLAESGCGGVVDATNSGCHYLEDVSHFVCI